MLLIDRPELIAAWNEEVYPEYLMARWQFWPSSVGKSLWGSYAGMCPHLGYQSHLSVRLDFLTRPCGQLVTESFTFDTRRS